LEFFYCTYLVISLWYATTLAGALWRAILLLLSGGLFWKLHVKPPKNSMYIHTLKRERKITEAFIWSHIKILGGYFKKERIPKNTKKINFVSNKIVHLCNYEELKITLYNICLYNKLLVMCDTKQISCP
jgi:hypothetical protein